MSCSVSVFPLAEADARCPAAGRASRRTSSSSRRTTMFRKKSTESALTGSPLDHFQPFMVTATVLPPLEYTGGVGGRQRVVDAHRGVGVVAEHVQRPVHQPLELLVVVHAGVGDRVEREDKGVRGARRQRERRRPALHRRAARGSTRVLELLELQPAATTATAATPATAARRSLRLHRFMCAPSLSRVRARDAMPVPAQALRLPVRARANPQHPRSSGPAAASRCGRLRVTLTVSPARRLSASPPGVSIRAPAWLPRASDTFVPATVRSERSFTDQLDSSSKCHNFLSMSSQAIAGPADHHVGVTTVLPAYYE